tara:strand:+ start:6301 stop:6903 length:603 start_codon:yes stop_codon:yes gene_type:complete
MALKHVGRIAANKRKVVVAYRTLPGEPENCLVVTTENLDAADHDSLMKLVESDAGQNEDEFATAMARTRLSDGRIMLAGFHTTGKMTKVPTSSVEMTPDRNAGIMLDELNKMIAEQRGVAIEDLAVKSPDQDPTQTQESTIATASEIPSTPVQEEVLDDAKLAAQYRSQADAMFKEAKRLREQAEELVPTKKKAKTIESV